MALGQSENSNKIFLHITFGKLRFKTTAEDTKAVSRENKNNEVVWERVFDYVEGTIASIYHKEDDKYGNSFEVTMIDGTEKYQVSLPENDNFFQDFFTKIPNLNLDKPVKLAPYDFEDKNTGKRRRGLTIWQDGNKIENYFVRQKDDKSFEYLHGYPQPEGNTKKYDRDDWKMYFIKVTKFLRNFAKDSVIPKLKPREDSDPIQQHMERELDAVEIDEDDNTQLPF